MKPQKGTGRQSGERNYEGQRDCPFYFNGTRMKRALVQLAVINKLLCGMVL